MSVVIINHVRAYFLAAAADANYHFLPPSLSLSPYFPLLDPNPIAESG